MKIACDKTNYKLRKNDSNEYIYIFESEGLKELLDTKLHCVYYKNIDKVDINTTHYDINCKRKEKITDNFEIKKRDYKIGIIIPNYNYEHTIEKCLNSILEQTYKNYEVIFIDDMSTDNSVKIAEQFQDKMNIKIIELKQKRYNGGARNEGYLYLSNDVDYVYYIDSDDWLYDKYALEKINKALIDEPSVLFVGLAKCRNNIISKERIPIIKDRYEALEWWSGSCGKVIKKELATRQDCLYNEGTLKEDKNQHCRICINMIDFKCLEDLIYVWNQDNYKSVTTKRDSIEWKTSTIRHYADTIQLYLSVKGKDDKIDKLLEERIRKCREEIQTGGDRQH